MWENNKIRRFAQSDENELLPIKICGKIVRQFKNDIKEEIDITNDEKISKLIFSFNLKNLIKIKN